LLKEMYFVSHVLSKKKVTTVFTKYISELIVSEWYIDTIALVAVMTHRAHTECNCTSNISLGLSAE
jgi:hypothetical protein